MKWMKMFSRGHHPLMFVDIACQAFRDLFHVRYGLPKINYLARHSGIFFVDEEEQNSIYREIRKKIYTKWPTITFKKMKADVDHALVMAQKISDKREINKGNLQDTFKAIKPALITANLPIFVIQVVSEEVGGLTKNYPYSQRVKVIELMNSPLYETLWQKYKSEIKKSKIDVNTILKKYAWLKSYFMDIRPLTRKDIFSDRKSLSISTDRQSSIGYLPKKMKRLIKLCRLYVWFRDYRLFMLNRIFYNLKPVLEKFAKRYQLNYEELKQLTIEEFLSGDFKKEKIRKRLKEYGIVLKNGTISIYTGQKLRNFKGEFPKIYRQKLTQVSGMIANQGFAKGLARIADSYTFHKAKKGEILIASETTPQSVKYISKIKAIVTDEGGLTSHAAIVARELGIPCIVGTKIATKVFKDGDLVEVDANKGVVRKI